jgi:hypothetical protein
MWETIWKLKVSSKVKNVKVNVDASFYADRLQGTLEVVLQTAVTSDLLQRALLNLILS